MSQEFDHFSPETDASQAALYDLCGRLALDIQLYGIFDEDEVKAADLAQQAAELHLLYLNDPAKADRIITTYHSEELRSNILSDVVDDLESFIKMSDPETPDELTPRQALKVYIDNLKKVAADDGRLKTTELLINNPALLQAAGFMPNVQQLFLTLDDTSTLSKNPTDQQIYVKCSLDPDSLGEPIEYELRFDQPKVDASCDPAEQLECFRVFSSQQAVHNSMEIPSCIQTSEVDRLNLLLTLIETEQYRPELV